MLTGVRNDMEIVQNEVFGPVLPVVPFETYDEVVEYANSTVYGLTAYVFTKDVTTAMRATDEPTTRMNRRVAASPKSCEAFAKDAKSAASSSA